MHWLQLAERAQEQVVVKELAKVVRGAGGADKTKTMSAMDHRGAADEAKR